MLVTQSSLNAPRVWLRSWVLPTITFIVSFAFSYGEGAMRMTAAPALIISTIAAGAVWLAQFRPVWALVALALLTIGLPVIQSTFSALDLVIVFVVFRATATTSIPIWALALFAFATLTLTDIWARIQNGTTFAEPSVLYPALLTALSTGLGAQNRIVLTQNAALKEHQSTEREMAVQGERRRIALDLHDLAAHHLTAIVVRNQLARRLNTPKALSDAADFTAETASDTLVGLKQVVQLLGPDGESPASLTPPSRFEDIDAMISRMNAAGLVVHYEHTPLGELPEPLQQTIVRIVQESLANVLKHRGPGECWLTIKQSEGHTVLRVEDSGSGQHARPKVSSNLGIAGMAERTISLGGTFTVGQSPKGGFLVSASFPRTT